MTREELIEAIVQSIVKAAPKIGRSVASGISRVGGAIGKANKVVSKAADRLDRA